MTAPPPPSGIGPITRRLLDELGDRAPRVLAIDPRDEMLQYALERHAGDADEAVAEYLADGAEVAEIVRALATWRHGGLGRLPSMLDFASGFGRVVRHLVVELPPERLTVAEILPDAVESQRRAFGVEAVLSAREPEALAIEGPFALVFVASLFTHLPESTFGRWLRRLAELVTADGVLAFSVHDAALLPEGRTLSAAGFCFEGHSESRSLDPADYGSAWVAERFVAARVEALGDFSCRRLPRAVCGFHDLYLVARRGVDLADFVYDPGPTGFVDHLEVVGGRRLKVSGWAADLVAGASPSAIDLRLEGREVDRVNRFSLRPGGSPVHGDEGEIATDWRLETDLPYGAPTGAAVVTVSATSASGRRRRLFHGRIQALELVVARMRLEAAKRDVAAARAELAGVRPNLARAARAARQRLTGGPRSDRPDR